MSPPTVLLQDRRLDGLAPVRVRPIDSSTAVTCAAFGACGGVDCLGFAYLVLGFRDGTLALYQMVLPSLARVQDTVRVESTSALDLQPVRSGAIMRLHKAAMGGVTAVAFIPGHNSRVVSIGHDGRCRLVDFEGSGHKLRT